MKSEPGLYFVEHTLLELFGEVYFDKILLLSDIEGLAILLLLLVFSLVKQNCKHCVHA